MDQNLGFYNSYYDNRGNLVDSSSEQGVMMSLIGQVFTVMTGLATSKQTPQIFNACMKYLKDERIGTLRLNTRLNSDAQDFGRAIGFAYGHKENGAAFNHMTVMFMNALYRRGFVEEGYQVFKSIYQLCNETQKSQIYPGIPEYFDPDGKGMYPYLTGSASWLMFTMLTEVYGIKGFMGDLKIHPKLVPDQFNTEGKAGVNFSFQGAKVTVTYSNPKLLEYKDYKIREIWLNDLHLDYEVYNSIYKEKELVLDNNEAKPETKWREILLAQKDLVSSQPE
jgi:cellobiose phosphorylase